MSFQIVKKDSNRKQGTSVLTKSQQHQTVQECLESEQQLVSQEAVIKLDSRIAGTDISVCCTLFQLLHSRSQERWRKKTTRTLLTNTTSISSRESIAVFEFFDTNFKNFKNVLYDL